tara:strand:- start:1363 stop:1551 length:189 start_codon:yes stop_codon:yes gene_type:complete
MITYTAIIVFCLAPTVCSQAVVETDTLLRCEFILDAGLAYSAAEGHYVMFHDCPKWVDGVKQ